MIKVMMNLKHIKKRFFSLKIKSKFLLAFLTIIFIVAITIGYVTLYTSNLIIMKNTEQLSQQIINQIAVNVSYQEENFHNFSFNFVNDSSADNTTLKSILQNINRGKFDITLSRALEKILSKYILAYRNSVESICIKTSSGEILYWEKGSPGIDLLKNDNIKFVGIYGDVFTRIPDTNYGSIWLGSGEVYNKILYGKQIIDPDSLNKLGDIVFTLNEDFFNITENDSYVIKETNIAILNNSHDIISASRESGTKELTEYVLQNNLIKASNVSTVLEYNKEQYIFTSMSSKNSKWEVLCFIPMPELTKNANYLKFCIMLICICTIIIAMGIAYAFSSNVTKNIKLLERSMKKVEEGDFSVRIKPASYDEIGLLGLRFNYMTNEINNLVNTVYHEKIAKQQAEFQMLLAQINPHFLYNTLGSIKWLAHMQNEEKIEQMLTSLVNLLEISFRRGEFITINEEISYIESYIFLQRFRYEDRFKVEYNIDRSIGHCYIMKFIMQPLFENALYHGIEMSKNNGIVKINIFGTKDEVILEVEDNGVGMSEDTMLRIMTRDIPNKSTGFNRIGVRNVDERIKLYFGGRFGIHYISSLNNGTKAVVNLPRLTDISEVENYDKRNDS